MRIVTLHPIKHRRGGMPRIRVRFNGRTWTLVAATVKIRVGRHDGINYNHPVLTLAWERARTSHDGPDAVVRYEQTVEFQRHLYGTSDYDDMRSVARGIFGGPRRWTGCYAGSSGEYSVRLDGSRNWEIERDLAHVAALSKRKRAVERARWDRGVTRRPSCALLQWVMVLQRSGVSVEIRNELQEPRGAREAAAAAGQASQAA